MPGQNNANETLYIDYIYNICICIMYLFIHLFIYLFIYLICLFIYVKPSYFSTAPRSFACFLRTCWVKIARLQPFYLLYPQPICAVGRACWVNMCIHKLVLSLTSPPTCVLGITHIFLLDPNACLQRVYRRTPKPICMV
jgi:hypothetical protein